MRNFFIDDNNGFICYKVTDGDLWEMDDEYDNQFGDNAVLNEQTDSNNPQSRKAGLLAEIVFAKYVGKGACRCKPEDIVYDFVSSSGITIDIKCKLRGVPPKSYFEASTYAYQLDPHFCVDLYVFCSTVPSFKYIWLCAQSTKKSWMHNSHGTYWKTGDIDPTNHKVFTKDTWSVPYKYLDPVAEYWRF